MYFTARRRHEIIRIFRSQCAIVGHINVRDIARTIARMPASRFWVSEERATQVISQLARGITPPAAIRPLKKRMFLEIYRRYRSLRQSRPDEPAIALIQEIINSPAPEFYLSPRSIAGIIYSHTRRQ